MYIIVLASKRLIWSLLKFRFGFGSILGSFRKLIVSAVGLIPHFAHFNRVLYSPSYTPLRISVDVVDSTLHNVGAKSVSRELKTSSGGTENGLLSIAIAQYSCSLKRNHGIKTTGEGRITSL